VPAADRPSPKRSVAPPDVAATLRARGVKPSTPRVEIARVVLAACDHPSADDVRARVRARWPDVSRATVYNTLNLFVKKGLLRALHLSAGRVVFDPKTAPHHHFVDDATGRIEDVPWERLAVGGVERLAGLHVTEYQVVLHGRRRR
jgi:Fur family iron response transcriptional regulator